MNKSSLLGNTNACPTRVIRGSCASRGTESLRSPYFFCHVLPYSPPSRLLYLWRGDLGMVPAGIWDPNMAVFMARREVQSKRLHFNTCVVMTFQMRMSLLLTFHYRLEKCRFQLDSMKHMRADLGGQLVVCHSGPLNIHVHVSYHLLLCHGRQSKSPSLMTSYSIQELQVMMGSSF